jgi:hypothetical protein
VSGASVWLHRRLLKSAALAGTVMVLAVGVGGQAFAASGAPAHTTHRITVRLDMSSPVGFKSVTVPLSRSDCAAMKRDKELAANARCVIGLALSVTPDARVRQCGPNGTWTTCYDKGTICAGDRPVWGGKNGSVSCAEAYVSVDGRWKYKHPANGHVWLLGHVSCPRFAAPAYGIHETFCGKRNNGHPILTMECDFDWSSSINGSGNGYIAIYAHDTGKVTLYGAWNA